MKKKILISLATSTMLLVSCTKPAKIYAKNLLDGVAANAVNARPVDNAFVNAVANFSMSLFNETCKEDNTLISPLSAYIALAMTANGASENTLTEMEAVLGGGIPIDQLNEYVHTYLSNLASEKKSKLEIANSIWFHEAQIEVKPSFLQTNKDYYNSASYSAPFDEQTIKDINNWVSNNTGGLINKILERIDPDTVMFLINTVLFDAEWQEKYEKSAVEKDMFTTYDGTQEYIEFLNSEEKNYISDESGAIGFIKPYFKNKYSFAAILPPENMDVYAYATSLSGADFLTLMKNKQQVSVMASMPKFEYECEYILNDALKALGMKDAFDDANFSKLGTSPKGNIYVGEVKQKTYIEVSEKGTKAAAVTSVGIESTSAPSYLYTVKLDRPFLYAIIDNATNLPIFIGAYTTV